MAMILRVSVDRTHDEDDDSKVNSVQETFPGA